VTVVSDIAELTGREPLASVAEVAAYMNVSEMTLYRMLEGNEGPPAYRIRRSVRFRWPEVDRWLEQQRVSA
jgi:excisionase family DNA binding protein